MKQARGEIETNDFYRHNLIMNKKKHCKLHALDKDRKQKFYRTAVKRLSELIAGITSTLNLECGILSYSFPSILKICLQ